MMSGELNEHLRQVSRLRSRIESTLLFGPEPKNASNIFSIDTQPLDFTNDSDRQRFLYDANEEVKSLQKNAKDVIAPVFQGISDRCHDAQSYLSQLQPALNQNQEIIDKFATYIRTEYKIQLLTIVKLLKQLEKCSNILDIPKLAISIKNAANMTVLEKSKIYVYMGEIVRSKKAFLLQKFHKLFEDHLDAEISSAASSSDDSSIKPSSDIYEDQKQVWRRFLERSRQWLLSYAMVSILPPIVIKSPKMIIERFKDALDEAMTPLWGRFYHHLKMGRESYSRNQILWTFKYASSFIEMLHSLCSHITAAEEMHHFYCRTSPTFSSTIKEDKTVLDFRSAAESQVLEKALKFLNAHVASIFVLVSPWEDSFGMQLVDELLEFDVWMSSFNPPSYLCHILFESKIFFHHWIILEQSLMHRTFDPSLISASTSSNNNKSDIIEPDQAFSKKFSTLLNHSESSANPVDSASLLGKSGPKSARFVSTDKTKTLQCYSLLYDALQYFLLARDRYALFPPAAQFILSELILEPLLCLSLGLFLYKIRCDPLLFAISMDQASSPSLVSLLNDSSQIQTPEALALFKDSIAYFQTTLSPRESTSDSNPSDIMAQSSHKIVANESRCKKRWTIVQEWMPKLLLSPDLRQQGYAISNLVKTAMKVSDKYRNHQNYAYRHQWTEHLQQLHQHTSSSVSSTTTGLESCIIMTRGLAITMADILDEQWQTLLAKHLSCNTAVSSTSTAAGNIETESTSSAAATSK